MTVTLLQKWQMLQAIMRDPEATTAGMVVAAALLDRYNTDTGRCDPSYETIAKDTGYERRQVIRGLASLKKKWVSVTSRGTKSNEFEFAWRRLEGGPESRQTKNVTTPAEPEMSPDEVTFSVSDRPKMSPKSGNRIREDSGKPARERADGKIVHFPKVKSETVDQTEPGSSYRGCVEAMQRLGIEEGRAKRIIGKWRKDGFDYSNILEAAQLASRQVAIGDPIASIRARLRSRRAAVGIESALATLEALR